MAGALSIGSPKNVSVSGTIKGENYVGGLIGFISGGVLESYTACDISGKDHLGGLAGFVVDERISIRNSYSNSNINGENSIGGIIGSIGNDGNSTVIVRPPNPQPQPTPNIAHPPGGWT